MNSEERKIYQYNLEVVSKFKDRTDMTEAQRRFYQASLEYVKSVEGQKSESVFYDVPLEENKMSVWKPIISDEERTRMQEYNARFERSNK